MEGASETGIIRVATAEKPAIQTQKEQRWKEVENEFSGVTDRLGREIDEGILDTVVALNVLGINTIQSCEGHMDHGTGAPYIDVAAKDTKDLETQLHETFGKEDIRETANKLIGEITRRNLLEQAKLLEHLLSFYQHRQVPYDRRVTIQSFGLGVNRLESQGAALQEIVTPEVKQQRLQRYQEEMREFTKYLKETYFSVAQ